MNHKIGKCFMAVICRRETLLKIAPAPIENVDRTEPYPLYPNS
jgi:hypothetical protein